MIVGEAGVSHAFMLGIAEVTGPSLLARRLDELRTELLRLVLDRDDDRRHGYGEYYTSRNPLTLERLMPVT